MAKKRQKATVKRKSPRKPSKKKRYTKDIPGNLAEDKAFETNKNLYKAEADSLQPTIKYQPSTTSPVRDGLAHINHKYLSTLQKILIIGIILITVMLIYGLCSISRGPRQSYAKTHTKRAIPTELADDSDEAEIDQQTEQMQLADVKEPEYNFLPSEPVSLKLAQTYYQQEDFKKAYTLYHQLLKHLPAGPKEEIWRDFLLLNMAFCMENTGDIRQAERLMIMAARSRSPALRVVAKYHQCVAQMQREKYLNAATKAYQIIALTDVISYDRAWALTLKHNCHFLVAESITKYVISLSDADKDLPPKLWSSFLELNPLTNLDEEQIRSFLNSGIEKLNKALLGPKVQILENQDPTARWLIICDGAPIDELLARLAANTNIQIHWFCDNNTQHPEIMTEAIRKRPVSLYLSAATPQQIVTIVAGSAGLIARMDNQNTMTIKDPTAYSSLPEHINMLAEEAFSLWQKLLLTTHSDERTPNIHFALGLLQAQMENLPEAIAEFKLIANRFTQSSLAPYALLHSSKLKTDLRDYSSAREDLKHLVEQYPDTDFSDRACLYLADATMKAGLYLEAARLYQKVYNIGLTLESQTKSAIGAGRCYYELRDYEAAAKWLTRYINFANQSNQPGGLDSIKAAPRLHGDKLAPAEAGVGLDRSKTAFGGTDNDYYMAWFLLGKSYIATDKLQQACNAFKFVVLKGQISKQIYIQTILDLAKVYTRQRQFIEALNILEVTHPWQFTQEEHIKILLAKANILRSIGLIDKAIAIIGDRAEFLPDPQLKVKILYELAMCYVTKEDFENACKNLTEILVLIEPGQFANDVRYELANACFKLGQFSQTISICLQILNSDPQVQIRQKTLELLAEIYKRQKNYDKAVETLLGQTYDTSANKLKTSVENATYKAKPVRLTQRAGQEQNRLRRQSDILTQ